MANLLDDLRKKNIPYRVGGEWPDPALEENRAVGPAGIARPTVRPRPPGPRPVPTAPDAAFGPVGDNGWFRSPVTPPLDSVPPGPAQPARPDYQDRAGFGRPETGPGGLPVQYVEPGRPAMPGPTEAFPNTPDVNPWDKAAIKLQGAYRNLSNRFAGADSPLHALGLGIGAGRDTVEAAGEEAFTGGAEGLREITHQGGALAAGMRGEPAPERPDPIARPRNRNPERAEDPVNTERPGEAEPSQFTRTVTPMGDGREMYAAADGKGNYLTGERAAGTGGGSLSTTSGPGSAGMSAEEWDALSNQEKIARNVAAYENSTAALQDLRRAQTPQAPARASAIGGYGSNQSGARALDDLMEGLTGEVDTMGGKANVLTAKGLMMQRHLPEVYDRVTGRADASTMADWAMKQQEAALKRQKALQEQANADRTYAMEQQKLGLRGTETDLKKAEYMDEFRQNFRERFSLAGVEGAPYERLAQDALRIASEDNMSPYDVQQRMVEVLAEQKGKKRAWDDKDKYNQFLVNVRAQQ